VKALSFNAIYCIDLLVILYTNLTLPRYSEFWQRQTLEGRVTVPQYLQINICDFSVLECVGKTSSERLW
jgi:hypothetical protein